MLEAVEVLSPPTPVLVESLALPEEPPWEDEESPPPPADDDREEVVQ